MDKIEKGYLGLRGLSFLMLYFLAALSLHAQEPIQHRIKEGETLFSISRQYRVPLNLILEANNITDPSRIRVGTSILIPNLYTVQRGDTLFGIARTFGIRVETLLEANNLQSNVVIRPGQTLFIPKVPDRDGNQDQGRSAAITPDRGSGPVAKNRPGRATTSPSPPSAQDAKSIFWPHPGARRELTGRLEGISFQGKVGDPVRSVASGRVAWIGPYRGFGRVIIIQSDQGYIFVYAGNETTLVERGDFVQRGQKIGTLGLNPYNRTPDLFFLVYKDGKPVRPEEAPRI